MGVPIGRELDIARLEVAVDHPDPVHRVDGAGQDLHQTRRLGRRPGGAVEPLCQAAPLDVLQLDEGAALLLAEVVDLHDVRVPQPRSAVSASAKNRAMASRSAGPTRVDHLQGGNRRLSRALRRR